MFAFSGRFSSLLLLRQTHTQTLQSIVLRARASPKKTFCTTCKTSKSELSYIFLLSQLLCSYMYMFNVFRPEKQSKWQHVYGMLRVKVNTYKHTFPIKSNSLKCYLLLNIVSVHCIKVTFFILGRRLLDIVSSGATSSGVPGSDANHRSGRVSSQSRRIVAPVRRLQTPLVRLPEEPQVRQPKGLRKGSSTQ